MNASWGSPANGFCWLKEQAQSIELEPTLQDVASQDHTPEYDELQHFVKKRPKAVALDGDQS
jgi:hypothetical protein